MNSLFVAFTVFGVMAAGWWYDHKSLMADKEELKRVSLNLLDEIERLRKKFGDTTPLVPRVLFPADYIKWVGLKEAVARDGR